jgi:DTW domain-containing protein YfiP
MVVVCWCGTSSRPGIFTDRHSALFKTLKPLIALQSAHTALPVCLVKQQKCLCKLFTKFAAKFHTHTHTHTVLQVLLIVTLSLIRRTAGARAQFSGCSSTTNAYSETGQMAVYCQNLTLGALSSCSALSVMVGALFEKFGLFLNTHRINPLNTKRIMLYLNTQSVLRSKHFSSRSWCRWHKSLFVLR